MVQRIIAIRKQAGLNQEQFAKRIGMSRSFINQVEVGKRKVSDRTISDICREFNVREEWLRNNEEPMFKKTNQKEKQLSELLEGRGIAPSDLPSIMSVVSAFLELDKPYREAVIQFVQSCAEKLNAPTADNPVSAADLAKKVEDLERQNKELLERLNAIEKEDAEKEKAGETLGASPVFRYR